MQKLLWAILLCGIGLLWLPSRTSAATYVNEFNAHPSSGDEWVEFYNPDGVDLTTYWLDDDASFSEDSGSSAKKALTSLNTSSPTYPYVVLTSAILNNSGDSVVLFAADGTLVDSYQYTSDPGADVIIGRSPDGGSWSVGLTASQGSTNPPAPTATPTLTPTPAPTSTPTPTPGPTSTPTSTPTPKPTSTPTPKPTPTSTPTSTPEIDAGTEEVVLGVQNGDTLNAEDQPEATETPKGGSWKTPAIAVALILPGLGLVGYSVYSYLQKAKGIKIDDSDLENS